MPPDLDNLETDIKTWVREFGNSIQKAISAEIAGLKDVVQVYMNSNDSEHKALRKEIENFRLNDKEIFRSISDVIKETDKKVTSVRLGLQEKIESNSSELHARIDETNKVVEEVKAAPAKKAQQLLSEIGKYILILVVGAAFTALIFWIKSGAPE